MINKTEQLFLKVENGELAPKGFVSSRGKLETGKPLVATNNHHDPELARRMRRGINKILNSRK